MLVPNETCGTPANAGRNALTAVAKILKEFVPLSLDWYTDGSLAPRCLFLEGGGRYEVDSYTEDGRKASRAGSGYGRRYTVRTSCEDGENWNKLFFLYLEEYGSVGCWRCDGLEIDMVRVIWDQQGLIMPAAIVLPDGFEYTVVGKVRRYPMSTRNTDGAGLRYIVSAACPELGDTRIFSLMLENGGDYLGVWFLEDYCVNELWNDVHYGG